MDDSRQEIVKLDRRIAEYWIEERAGYCRKSLRILDKRWENI
jgi:hypothetical protein